jgi:squalene monooxygenase
MLSHHNIITTLIDSYEQIFVGLVLSTAFTIFIFQTPKPNHSKWSAHLKRLNLINVIAIVMFITSLLRMSDDLKNFGRLSIIRSALPLLGLLFSLTYFFGFFGVTYAAAVGSSSSSSKTRADEILPLDSLDRIIVIGGGVAGCSAALALAKQGHCITLIERDLSEQDRIVGELLQPGGLRALERLGIDDCAKDEIDSIFVHGYVILDPTELDTNGKPIQQVLRYPKTDPRNFSEYFGYLKSSSSDSKDDSMNKESPVGRSFHHGRFIQRLRQKAIEHPRIEVIEGTVTKLIEEKGNVIVGVEYKILEKQKETESTSQEAEESGVDSVTKSSSKRAPTVRQLHSKLTLVADGIWSSQRKHLSSSTIHSNDSWVGIIVKHDSMRSPVPHPHHGHVILTQPAPSLIYQISSTETRVLINLFPDSSTGSIPSISDGSMETYLRDEIAPQMPEIFRPAFLQAITPGHALSSEYKSMPSKYFNAMHSLKKGAFLIGDALNMRNPLTGGGMTVCIRDGELLAEYLSDIHLSDFSSSSPEDKRSEEKRSMDELYALLHQRYELFLTKRVDYAGTINVLACALHGVFSTPNGDQTRHLLRQACFDYLALGGAYAAGPIGLLSGLTPKPLVLTTHFFLVAFYGAGNILNRQGISLQSFQRIHLLLRVACTIIMPLLRAEKTTVLSGGFLQTVAKILFPPIEMSGAVGQS